MLSCDLKNRETYGDICIYRLKKEWPSAIQDFYKKDLRVKKKSFVFIIKKLII